MEKLKKIAEKINWNNIIYLGISFILIGLFYYDLAYKTQYFPARKYKIIYLIIALILFLILSILSKTINKIKDKNFHIIYLVMASVLGIIYLFLSPFLTGSDEYAHFLRTYEITEGVLVTPVANNGSSSLLPSAIGDTYLKKANEIKYNDIKEMIKIKIDGNDRKLYNSLYTGASLYNPIQYTPQIIGISLGKVLEFGLYIMGMLGRLMNFLFYLLITTIAIKLLPYHKLFAMTILLSPTILNTATTLSCDALTNAIIILYIAYILNIIYYKKQLKKIDYIFLGLLTILISIFKIIYIPLVGLLFLIPKDSFKGRKNKNFSIIIMVTFGIIISLCWLNNTTQYFNIVYSNSALQKNYIFTDLIRYVFILIRTVFVRFMYVWENIFAGNEMYSSQLKMYELISLVFIVINLLSLSNEQSKNKISIYQRFYVVLLIFIVMGLMFTALYLQVTAQYIQIGYSIAGGLQGRYFIPIMLLGVILFGKSKIKKIDYTLILKTLILATFSVYLTLVVNFIV